jgi:HPr kinase/phosphorylase
MSRIDRATEEVRRDLEDTLRRRVVTTTAFATRADVSRRTLFTFRSRQKDVSTRTLERIEAALRQLADHGSPPDGPAAPAEPASRGVADPTIPEDRRKSVGAAAEPAASGRAIVHGTAIAWLDRGILLLGRPGSGKSDLALRLIDAGARLVADDLVALEATGNRLVARAHGAPGLIELRGQGIFRQAALAEAAIDIVVRLGPATEPIERLPPAGQVALADVTLPAFDLDPFPASAVARLRLLATGERVF